MSSIAALLQAAEYLERRERGTYIQRVIWSVKNFISSQSELKLVKITKLFFFHKKCIQLWWEYKRHISNNFDGFVYMYYLENSL